jgi:hypothetical protein
MLPAMPPALFLHLPAPGLDAQPTAPARDREVAFAGFNGFPLKGTVQAATAQAAPWFAVLAADAGPLDRDGTHPMLPGSHPDRDLAHWLAAQGIGSLRFDKRIHGASDPRLDSSLDAQSGDLQAALATARELPEARGRHLLLLGRGEGALLALLVARDADALLLVGMPPQSMARSLVAQLQPQFPKDTEGPNLRYLEAVFQAIRERKPQPAVQGDVHPALVRLGASLMAPETLAFVRETLDLDPWALAARVIGPVALVWGDRDVQARKPASIPASFHGTVLELPEANHLLRRETRPRSILDGTTALDGYGDEVPLADLAPVAAWIKGLPR